ncbi:MAG: hypothetical protein LBP38_01295 [Desulfovibrio sp.]|jgi:hypothetical protein|nr:hypothetical protein [Desulfovibrio sp.]
MILLAHRGCTDGAAQENSRAAFRRCFDAGFGAETDLRDAAGEIVVAHDMPQGGEPAFEEVLQIMDGRNLPLALNIKADGLGEILGKLLARYGHTNYFTFDMSVPEMLRQIRGGLQVFTGLSDIAAAPVMLAESAGIWLDCFHSDWYEGAVIDDLLAGGKKLCIVSAELHGRSAHAQWERIKCCANLKSPNLMLCTNMPEKGELYFNGRN